MTLIDQVDKKLLLNVNEKKWNLLQVLIKYSTTIDDSFKKIFNFLLKDVKLKLDLKDFKDKSVLHYAFETKNNDLINLLFETLSKPEAEKLLLSEDKNGNQPFATYFSKGADHTQILKLSEIITNKFGR